MGNCMSGGEGAKGAAKGKQIKLEKQGNPADYKIGKKLGEGHFAAVHACTQLSTGKEFAVKIIDLTKKDVKVEAVMAEIAILDKVKHTNCIALEDQFLVGTKLHLVMEIVTGGELFDEIVKQDTISEKDAATWTHDIADALRYLHSIGVVHRDLKPENILLSHPPPGEILKIGDFGLSAIVDPDDTQNLTQACGTPIYVAPEVIDVASLGAYTSKVDVWSMGVITYIMLCGFPPFWADDSSDMDALFDAIRSADFEFHSPYWDEISDDAKDFIERCFVIDPSHRMSPNEALAHPWLAKAIPEHALPQANLERMRNWNAKRKLKKGMQAIVATQRLTQLGAMAAAASAANAAASGSNDTPAADS